MRTSPSAECGIHAFMTARARRLPYVADDEGAARAQRAPHLERRQRRIGVMVERVVAVRRIKRIIAEGQALRVAHDHLRPPAETLGRPLGHVRRKVDPHEGAARDLVEDDFGEGPGPAPQVQHAGRVDAAARPGDLARHDAVEPPRMVPLHSGVVGLSLGVERCPRPRLQLVCVLLFHVALFY